MENKTTHAKSKVVIPKDILEELDALPRKTNSPTLWTPEMEEVLRKYYPITSASRLRPILEKMSDKKVTLTSIYRKKEEMGL